jgi:hypothetical protein
MPNTRPQGGWPLTCDKCKRIFAVVWTDPKAVGTHRCPITKRQRQFRYRGKE